jgi:hypothetical protein
VAFFGSWHLKIGFSLPRHDTAAVAISPLAAPTSRVSAANCLCGRSSANFLYCRRVCVNSVALLVFRAVFLRIFGHEIRNSVARPMLAAVHFGDNFLKCVKFKESCNTSFSN